MNVKGNVNVAEINTLKHEDTWFIIIIIIILGARIQSGSISKAIVPLPANCFLSYPACSQPNELPQAENLAWYMTAEMPRPGHVLMQSTGKNII